MGVGGDASAMTERGEAFAKLTELYAALEVARNQLAMTQASLKCAVRALESHTDYDDTSSVVLELCHTQERMGLCQSRVTNLRALCMDKLQAWIDEHSPDLPPPEMPPQDQAAPGSETHEPSAMSTE